MVDLKFIEHPSIQDLVKFKNWVGKAHWLAINHYTDQLIPVDVFRGEYTDIIVRQMNPSFLVYNVYNKESSKTDDSAIIGAALIRATLYKVGCHPMFKHNKGDDFRGYGGIWTQEKAEEEDKVIKYYMGK